MGKKVLIIEDERLLAKLLERALVRQGYQVTCASDGAEGVEKALQEDFDWIVCDVLMPRLNGAEVVATLRGNGNTTPICLMSGNTGDAAEQVISLIQSRSVNGFLEKPFPIQQLLDVLRQAA